MSILTINTSQGDAPIPHSQWKKLQSIWTEIEKKQRRNSRYEEKVTHFFNDFQTQFADKEAEVCVEMEALALHLISFIQNKSMNEQEKENVHHWIDEIIFDLESNPFRKNDISALKRKAHGMLFQSIKENDQEEEFFETMRPHFEAMMEEVSGEKHTLSDEEVKRLFEDPSRFYDILKEKTKEKASQDDDFNNEFDFSDEECFDEPSDDRYDKKEDTEKFENFFNTKFMTKLYRQLAKQFHPDKEIELAKKEEKNELMQQLSQAKKEKDTFAMLLMAQQWLPDFEMNLDDAAINSLEATLKTKVAHLNHHHRKMQDRNDVVGLVWQRFGGGSKKTQQLKFGKHVQTLNNEKKNIQSQCATLNSVKAMRKALRLRENSSYFDDIFKDIKFNFAD